MRQRLHGTPILRLAGSGASSTRKERHWQFVARSINGTGFYGKSHGIFLMSGSGMK